MPEAEGTTPNLGDFFAKKGKKKIKGTNLNNATEAKQEDKKKDKKDAEEEGWGEEEQVVANTMKVEAAGKLMREDEGKKEDDAAATKVWGNANGKKNKGGSKEAINEKKFPTLASSVRLINSNINIDDGSDARVNIETSKNVFASLEDDDDGSDEDNTGKRPKQITPALVQKKRGEFEKAAVQREVDKYVPKGVTDAIAEGDDEAAEDGEEEAARRKPKARAHKAKVPAKEENEEENEEDDKENQQIQPDLAAAKAKYDERRRLPPKELPREELEELKVVKPQAQAQGKKKKLVAQEEDYDKKKKLAYVDA